MVRIGFYLWTLVAILFLMAVVRNAAQPKKALATFGLMMFLWMAYTTMLSSTEILHNFDMPPRLPLLLVVPAIIGIVWVTWTKEFRSIIARTPMHLPVYLQSFRVVVELLIYGAFLDGIFPKLSTFEGINFDVLVGLSAPAIGYLVQSKKMGPKSLRIWNVASLLVLSVTAFSFVYSYYATDHVNQPNAAQFIEIPYIYLPAVLLPSAIFFHVFSLRQITRKIRGSKTGL